MLIFGKEPLPQPQLVKKFYFLDYISILLSSCKTSSDNEAIFQRFKSLKERERLGESKYKKLTIEDELTASQIRRYRYTFQQVISESTIYGLVREEKGKLYLTDEGIEMLGIAERDKRLFYNQLLLVMEEKYFAFYHLINLLYSLNVNTKNNGLLIFPIYSPKKLGIEIGRNSDWVHYSEVLRKRLESDISKYLGSSISLADENNKLLNKLQEDSILIKNSKEKFNQEKYNALSGRFRKHWLNFFLIELYKYPYSFDTFNIWIERGKQLGIVHTTEFYPNFDGRLVFPTSIIAKKTANADFKQLFEYTTGEKLFIHNPDWKKEKIQEMFVDDLVNVYYDLRRSRRTQFIRVADLREKVVYRLRIPSFLFNEYLQSSYNESLKGNTKVQISLEADRLPYETNAMYLKREPVLVNDQYKNIIAIDYKRKE